MKQRSMTLVPALVALVLAACARGDVEAAPTQASATHLIIEFHVKEDRLADFLAVMIGINEAMAAEAGFETAAVYRDQDNPLIFTLIEQWDSRALHEAHYDRIVESGDWANILDMLTRTPALRYNEQL